MKYEYQVWILNDINGMDLIKEKIKKKLLFIGSRFIKEREQKMIDIINNNLNIEF